MNDEILVPLDLSDAIAMIDRQKEQITALTAENASLKEKREIWEERNVQLEMKCCALTAENKRLRQIVIDCHAGWPDEILQKALGSEEVKDARNKIPR